MAQIAVQAQMYSQTCCNCGIEFAVPSDFDKRRREDHKSFYCPWGHSQSYTGDSTEQKLRRELAEAQRQRDEAQRRIEFEKNDAIAARRVATTAKNKLKRIEHRVNCGVCPHCQRTFKQLAAHMKSKHGEKTK